MYYVYVHYTGISICTHYACILQGNITFITFSKLIDNAKSTLKKHHALKHCRLMQDQTSTV